MRKATARSNPANAIPRDPPRRIYSVCFFEAGFVVSNVKLIDAISDDEAIESARTDRLFTTREVWSGHRLVAVIPPAWENSSQSTD